MCDGGLHAYTHEPVGVVDRAPGDAFERVDAVAAADVAREGKPTLAVTHRGVIRVVLAQACGWDMRGPPPAKLDWHAVQLFQLDADGAPSVERLNVR